MAEKSENGAKDYLFSAAGRDAIHDEINKYLNSTTRVLLPNEERLIKRVAHGYNILVTTVAIIIGSGVIIGGLKYISTKITGEVKQEVISGLKKDMDKITQEIATFSESFNETKNRLTLDGRYFSDQQKEINTKMKEVVSSGKRLDETQNTADAKITDVEKLILKLDRYNKLSEKFENLFKILDKTQIGQLMIENNPDKNQYIFRVGVLQVLWGSGKTRAENEWTEVPFVRPFADSKRVFVSVSSDWPEGAGDGEADEKAFVQTSDITKDRFKCKLIRRRLLAHEIQKKAPFKFLAIGQIDEKVSESTR